MRSSTFFENFFEILFASVAGPSWFTQHNTLCVQHSPTGMPTIRSNSNNRRQWRIKGVAVGAAASKT